jgi:lipoate-protein ligase A
MGVDVEKMFAILKVPDEKLRGKMVEGVKASVTSLQQILGSVPEPSLLADALEEGMASSLPGRFLRGNLTLEEEGDAIRISQERYTSQAWTRKR